MDVCIVSSPCEVTDAFGINGCHSLMMEWPWQIPSQEMGVKGEAGDPGRSLSVGSQTQRPDTLASAHTWSARQSAVLNHIPLLTVAHWLASLPKLAMTVSFSPPPWRPKFLAQPREDLPSKVLMVGV